MDGQAEYSTVRELAILQSRNIPSSGVLRGSVVVGNINIA
jgi:hypothetical protein